MPDFVIFLLMYAGLALFCLVMGKWTPIAMLTAGVVFFVWGQIDAYKRNKSHFTDAWKAVKSVIPKKKTPFQKIVYASIDEIFQQLEYRDILVLESDRLKKSFIQHFDKLNDEEWKKREGESAEQLISRMVNNFIVQQIFRSAYDSGLNKVYLRDYKSFGEYRVSKGYISEDEYKQELVSIKKRLSDTNEDEE